ncbi:LysM peptidoglycan-binding domain-containing protein [Treponema sp. OMZ 787]
MKNRLFYDIIKLGDSLQKIAQATGLSLEEIEKL